MQNFENIIKNLSQKYELETGRLPKNIEQDIQKLLEKCPNLVYASEFLDFQRQFGGFLMHLDNGSFSVWSVNSPDIFPLLTGEGDLIDEQGFLCMADYTFRVEDEYSSKAWGFCTAKLLENQYVYEYESTTKTWIFAYQNFIEMLENIEF